MQPLFPVSLLVAYLNGCIMEIWKDVPGYVGLYQVSNYGNVKSILYNKILKSCWRNSKKEYKTVYLSNCNKRKTFSIHRLVAAAFIPNPNNKPCVDHIDGNRLNNHVDNLRWATHLENNNNPITLYRKRQAAKKGFLSCRYGKIGKLNGKSKAVIRFSMNNKLIDEFESINIASNITGINKRGIALAANKKCKTAGGYIWKIK